MRIERAQTNRGRSPLGITYEPSWVTVSSEPSPELQRLTHGQNVSQMLSELGRLDKNLSNVVAVTRYQVEVSFEGTSRTYNAAVLWLDPERDGIVALAVQDNITDRVDEAVTERLRAAPRVVFEQQIRATASLHNNQNKATSCSPHDSDYSFPLSAGPDPEGHSTGYHSSSARFNYSCHCDSTCRSTCAPQITDAQCHETGSLSGAPGTHKPRTSQKIVGGSKPNTDFTGADCGAGYACYIQFCPANVCSGFVVSATAQPLDTGIGVTFNASSQAVWDGQLEFPFQRDGCSIGEPGDAPVPTIECQEYTPPGGEGGGGTFGCFWSCQSIWNGRFYREECNLIC